MIEKSESELFTEIKVEIVMTKPSTPLDRETHDLLIRILKRMSSEGQTLVPIIRHGTIEEGKQLIISSHHIKPGDPPEITVTRIGIIVADHQGVAIHRLDGSITTASGGAIEMTQPAVSRIEVHDLRLVTGHAITTVHETVSHHLQFAGGGSFTFMMDGNDKVLETVSRDVLMHSDGGGVIRLLGTAPDEDDRAPGHD
ncbi:hypothetical protein QTI33_33935 [Variovorax sp. J22P271]|uniref:hypothetical protein n=1 Tax=Variovorax davisae TaxID=3053515 RepID=UPI002576BF16|nr:hypothetical protein [Variovorax sp. J22P271]MDM0037173.1 hypothetical protein [Variovorax sp. J22P271]